MLSSGSRGLALAVVLSAATAGGEPVDFGGRWALVVEVPPSDQGATRPPIPATAGSGWGHEITITQDTGRMTIERHQFVANDMQPPMRYVYALGGAESRNVVDMGRGPQEEVARATLDGGTLVIVSRHAEGTSLAAEVRQVFTIDSAGDLLVETTRTASGTTSVSRARYRRQAASPHP